MPESPAPQATYRILAIVADEALRATTCRALTEIGMTVESADGAEPALESIQRSLPDLVILDLEISGEQGLELCRAVHELTREQQIPVLVITDRIESESIDQALRAGANDFVKKPIDPPLLQHRVRFLMNAVDAVFELGRTLSVLSESEKRMADAQRLARVGSWEWVPGSEQMLWSEEVHRIFRVPQHVEGSTYAAFLDVVHPDDREAVEKAMQRAATESRPWSLDHRIVLPGGELKNVQQQAEVERGASGETLRISGTIQDISDRRRAEDRIRYLAHYDSLTALPNRKLMVEHLQRVLRQADLNNEQIGLLFLDLDRFKRINDTLGHGMGDALLKAIAERLFQCLRSSDYVGRSEPRDGASLSRLGGDEFTIVLRGLSSSEDAANVARRVLETLRAPIVVEGQRLDVTTSLGIALHPSDGSDPETLLRNASAAVYHAKKLGRDQFQFFNESINKRAIRNIRLESGLRAGIERGELMLHYQPQFDAQTEKIVSVEALVRWRSPDHGFLPPADFIPLAEETGLIVPVGEWVLRTACAQLRAWLESGYSDLRMAVNVSSKQVHRGGLLDTVERALRDTLLEPSFLEVEITESVLIGHEADVVETLTGLRNIGVKLSLDDFGTGYSSLSHLVEFPIDALKIDRSFVNEIGTEGNSDAIISAVLAMAHRLELTVTAEGVETRAQQQFLQAEGCDLLQGFLLSRPVAAEPLEELLEKRKEL